MTPLLVYTNSSFGFCTMFRFFRQADIVVLSKFGSNNAFSQGDSFSKTIRGPHEIRAEVDEQVSMSSLLILYSLSVNKVSGKSNLKYLSPSLIGKARILNSWNLLFAYDVANFTTNSPSLKNSEGMFTSVLELQSSSKGVSNLCNCNKLYTVPKSC